MGGRAVSFIDRNAILAGLNYTKGQFLTRWKLRQHHSGSTAIAKSVEEAADYARDVVADYITYGGGGDPGCLAEKEIVEIGPGDNLGVALMLLAKGARKVTCIDGFEPASDAAHNARVYFTLYDRLTEEERQRVRDVVAVRGDRTATVGGDRLISRYGVRIDAPVSPLPASSCDLVLSRAVLEHVEDMRTGWKNMARSLRPDGGMWHKVDFRCHNLFGEIHPLYFLTVGDRLWNTISRPDPTLNRLRLPEFRQLAEEYFREARFYMTHVVGNVEAIPHPEMLLRGSHYGEKELELVRRIRPRLLPRYQAHSDEELLVNGVFLAVRLLR
jgi:SAM-dependent methyltransferase